MLKALGFGLLLSCGFANATATAPVESQFDILGYSPELHAAFAQAFVVPDDGKCASYILDFDSKTKFVLRPLVGVSEAIAGIGEDAEASSCALREFEAQLEIKLKTAKTYSEEEKKLVQPLGKADWSKALPGYKTGTVESLGTWLRVSRPTWHPELAVKLYELGVSAAEDKDWMDGFSALLIANDWKPRYSSQAGREQSKQLVLEADKLSRDKNDVKSLAKADLALEMATRLDAKNAQAWLGLAKIGRGGYERMAQLIVKALKIEPVLTTRMFREDADFLALRCEKKAQNARKVLPAELVRDMKCGG